MQWVRIIVCSLTGMLVMLRRTPALAGLSKYWDSELTPTAVRSLTRVWQPDQSSVSLLSWYVVLLWVTSTALQIPNDGWCAEMLPLGLFYSHSILLCPPQCLCPSSKRLFQHHSTSFSPFLAGCLFPSCSCLLSPAAVFSDSSPWQVSVNNLEDWNNVN